MGRNKCFLLFGGIVAIVVTTLLRNRLDRAVFRETSPEIHRPSESELNRQAGRTQTTEFLPDKQEAKITPHSHVNTGTPPSSCFGLFEKLETRNAQVPRTNVIILTYMRSGSTLTGEMFEQHPDVFYVFEPMHTLKWIWWSQKTRINFFDRSSRVIKSAEDFARAAKDIADGFLRCHPSKIDVATLSQHHLRSSNDTKPYHACLQQNPGVLKILNCLPILQKQCMESDVSVIKTIRFPMEAAERMMKSNPSLKVIHLIRDPRPTIKSQISLGRDTWSNLHSYSKQHCLRVLGDLQATRRLLKTHPNRTKLLLYEDLVVHPSQHVKDLLSFVGLTYSSETERFLQSRTNSSDDKHCVTCTQKSNSSIMALQWRKEIDFSRVRIIDANCKEVYQMLGYLPVNTESELVDMSKSLKIDSKL